MTSGRSPAPKKRDHRPRVAQLRRERTRSHILSVVRDKYPGRSNAPVTLDEILKTAEISKGTFYKYFSSLEDAVSELGAELARQMIIDMNAVYSPLKRPLDRVAMGCQLFLYRGLNDRNWATFISHIQDLPQDNLFFQAILENLENGKANKQFRIVSVQTAAWAVTGMTFAALKQISRGGGSREFVRETVILMLRALGASEKRLTSALDKTEAVLFDRGPEAFDWWSDDHIT